MYNRYIPQPDGTYCRRRMQEQRPSPPPVVEAPCDPPPEPPREPECRPQPAPCPPPKPRGQRPPPRRNQQPSRNRPEQSASVGSFLKNLLPKDFDTGDLLVVLLLLLMAGDCQDDQNNALLTLALYLFM